MPRTFTGKPKGAFTGATSVHLARGAGASATLVGHSERRHVFGETDAETNQKVRAALARRTAGACSVLARQLEEREAGQTAASSPDSCGRDSPGVPPSADLVIAYEPVWAIGTGRTATPADAGEVHARDP